MLIKLLFDEMQQYTFITSFYLVQIMAHLSRASFLPLWRVAASEGLLARIPGDLIVELCWEGLVSMLGRGEVIEG